VALQIVLDVWLGTTRPGPGHRIRPAPSTSATATTQNLAPIWTCVGGESEVLVFGAEDGSSISVTCTKVKS